MTTAATIRLIPELCEAMIADMESLDWDAAERGDIGTEDAWGVDGEEFGAACSQAVAAIDAGAGRVDGELLAAALEQLRAIELRWGDDPQAQRARRMVAQRLGWATEGRDLMEMLRSGED